MAQSKTEKLRNSITHLEKALQRFESEHDERALNFLLVAKAFEVLVEYAWKHFREVVIDEGLDARSPKEAIRKAAELGLLDDAETWIDCINARNDSVHDYFAVPEEDYIALSRKLLELAGKI